jgi:hypothetical protein
VDLGKGRFHAPILTADADTTTSSGGGCAAQPIGS